MDILGFLGRRKMTQKELSALLGIAPQNVSRWAKGDGVHSYDVCSRLLRLGMTTREIFGIDSQEPETSQETPPKFDRRIEEYLKHKVTLRNVT